MSSATRSGPQLAVLGGGVILPPSAEKIQAKFDLAIALVLHSWTSLTIAVQNSWGGSNASEKREWFAGQISELITDTPNADVEYIEEFLIGVMNDNFDVYIDDGSAEEIAAKIVSLRKLILQGDFALVDDMFRRWEERQAKGGEKRIDVQKVEGEQDQDTDWDSEGEKDDGDVEMNEAPELVSVSKQKTVPKVDEEGFTEVVGKKRR